jgi:hypothetical protein
MATICDNNPLPIPVSCTLHVRPGDQTSASPQDINWSGTVTPSRQESWVTAYASSKFNQPSSPGSMQSGGIFPSHSQGPACTNAHSATTAKSPGENVL